MFIIDSVYKPYQLSNPIAGRRHYVFQKKNNPSFELNKESFISAKKHYNPNFGRNLKEVSRPKPM